MKLSLLAGIIALAVSLVMAFTLAAAAETSSSGGKPIKDRRWYVGGGIGAADDKDFNETDPGGKLFGGYRVSKFFSLEGAFVGLGQFGDGSLGIGTGGEVAKGGLSVQAVGTLPLGKRGQLFGKAGAFFWSVIARETCTTVSGRQVCVDNGRLDDGVDPVVGGGFQYRFSDRWGGRVEYERYFDVGNDDVDLGSISALYNF